MRSILIPLLAAAILGCSPASLGSSLDVGEIRYSCGSPPGFLPGFLDQPAVAEQEDHPSAAALRASIAEVGLDIDMLPPSGYWLVHRDDRSAEYLARVAGDPHLVQVSFQLEDGGWRIAGWGGCRPRIVLDGLSLTTWVLAPDVAQPGADATSFTALVTETECTGGEAMGDRLLPPSISYGDDAVLVVFAARPLDLGMATCPGNPASRVAIELREPLGDRVLRDAGTFPPTDPAAPAS